MERWAMPPGGPRAGKLYRELTERSDIVYFVRWRMDMGNNTS